jgi:microcystin-dependent protein
MAAHPHTFNGTTTAGDKATPESTLLGTFANLYTGASNLTALAPGSISMVGGSQAHPNMQPYLTLNFCIALQGIFPSQN